MNHDELMREFERLADLAVQRGIFVDVFFTQVYTDGSTGTTHAACNHDGHQNTLDVERSNSVWLGIASGLIRRVEGEEPQDERHPEHDFGAVAEA